MYVFRKSASETNLSHLSLAVRRNVGAADVLSRLAARKGIDGVDKVDPVLVLGTTVLPVGLLVLVPLPRAELDT
jgi:hypothetical protein